jgi:hypothetical protein
MATPTITGARWEEPQTLVIVRQGGAVKTVNAKAVLAGGHKYCWLDVDHERDEVLVHSCPKSNQAPTTTHIFSASGGSKGSRAYKP